MSVAVMADDNQVLLRLAELADSLASFRNEVREEFQSVHARLDETQENFDLLRAEVGSRFAQFEQRLIVVEDQLVTIEATLIMFGGRIVTVERRLDTVDRRIDSIERRIDDDRNGDERL